MAKTDLVTSVQEATPLYFILTYLLTVAAPTTTLIVSAYVLLGIYWNEPCGNNLMSLQVWLLVFAIFETLYLLKSAGAAYHRKERTGASVYVYGAGVHWLFMIIWNIIGAVDLFNSDCQTALYPIYAITISVLAIHWIILSCYACLCCCICCGACCSGIAQGMSGKK
ncbi:hypothetical protein Klosneuvirus_3_144 [Klosneuvirus KNV1]|uniref:Transmembrane protein n=1 Tax=Klosneuvirus KNV1 TaxID=1977640 RepID=A0A1V0SJU3_9VIRU|nr:hypothetical protein Klosneuvirus_3_144 [Klosneuvirus KNV1]